MSFQAYIDNIFKQTGKTQADFKKLAEEKSFIVNGEISKTVKATEIYNWLMLDFGLGLGYARAIHQTFKSSKGNDKAK
jgi:hypothetical protein